MHAIFWESCVFRENLNQWEKIVRGEEEDLVWTPAAPSGVEPSEEADSGPVKVDN